MTVRGGLNLIHNGR